MSDEGFDRGDQPAAQDAPGGAAAPPSANGTESADAHPTPAPMPFERDDTTARSHTAADLTAADLTAADPTPSFTAADHSRSDPPASDEDTGDGCDEPGTGPLDVLLFAPIGLCVTVAEDWPQIVTKGRTRVENQISNARVLGQMVVHAGQRALGERIGSLFGGASPDAPIPEYDDTTQGPPTAPAAAEKPAADPLDTAAVERALAGYDTLSASQVVRRLESLEVAQLEAVHRYEASHRNRRTILNRTRQLIDGVPPLEPDGSLG